MTDTKQPAPKWLIALFTLAAALLAALGVKATFTVDEPAPVVAPDEPPVVEPAAPPAPVGPEIAPAAADTDAAVAS